MSHSSRIESRREFLDRIVKIENEWRPCRDEADDNSNARKDDDDDEDDVSTPSAKSTEECGLMEVEPAIEAEKIQIDEQAKINAVADNAKTGLFDDTDDDDEEPEIPSPEDDRPTSPPLDKPPAFSPPVFSPTDTEKAHEKKAYDAGNFFSPPPSRPSTPCDEVRPPTPYYPETPPRLQDPYGPPLEEADPPIEADCMSISSGSATESESEPEPESEPESEEDTEEPPKRMEATENALDLVKTTAVFGQKLSIEGKELDDPVDAAEIEKEAAETRDELAMMPNDIKEYLDATGGWTARFRDLRNLQCYPGYREDAIARAIAAVPDDLKKQLDALGWPLRYRMERTKQCRPLEVEDATPMGPAAKKMRLMNYGKSVPQVISIRT